MSATGSHPGAATVATGRFELLRALGTLTALAPPGSDRVAQTLGLPAWSRVEHTQLFVLDLPPYAAVHLGPEGKLGGEGADRVAGLWRTLGLSPPPDVDHLATLLALYSELGEASQTCRSERARGRLEHARTTLLWEHLWCWVPGYLDATSDDPSAGPWAALARAALTREAALSPGAPILPLALRVAPEPIDPADSYEELLDSLTVPVRTGFVLTPRDVVQAARLLGMGLRRGERRFALKAMLEQDATLTLGWLASHARAWVARHGRRPSVLSDPGPWWAARAAHSAEVLDGLARRAARSPAVAAERHRVHLPRFSPEISPASARTFV